MSAKTNKANLDLLITDPESAQSKLNEMQKKFVDLFCGTDDLSQTESARLAGYKYPSLSGHQLMRKPHVVACIEDRRKEISHRYKVTLDRSFRDLKYIRDRAMEDGSWTAALKAEELRLKAAGLLVSKSEVRTGSIDAMSEDEIRAELSRLSEEASKNTVVLPPEAFEDITESGSGDELDDSGQALNPDDKD